MERLWTPWRLAYVTNAADQQSGCIFCAALARNDADPLIVHRGERTFVILNKYPYNSGHLMVVPHRHVGRLADLDARELLEFATLAQLAERALGEAYRAHGFNMGVNLGKSAGAGVLDHVHLHVVPRWDGDTNFVSVVGETRVLPEELPETASRLREVFDRLASA